MANILFVSPDFFDYYKDISNEFKKMGHEVTWYNDRPSNSFIDKVIIRLNKKMLKKKIDKYLDKIIEENKNKKFDIVLFIFGQSFEKRHIHKLREANPNARFIYYTWDSIAAFPVIGELYSEFDVAYSFDDEDCKKYKMNFLPLFYSNEVIESEIKYDCCAIQTIKVGKLENFDNIKKSLPENVKLYSYLYLQSKLVYLYYRLKYKIFKKYKMKDFNYKKLSRKEANKISSESNVVIDCQMKNQIGLTIRSFEALHLKKKLITSNANIKKYEFYTPNNIYVIEDYKNINIPKNFFETEFDENYKLSENYSIENFAKNLIK